MKCSGSRIFGIGFGFWLLIYVISCALIVAVAAKSGVTDEKVIMGFELGAFVWSIAGSALITNYGICTE